MQRFSMGRRLLAIKIFLATSAVPVLLLSASCAPRGGTEADPKVLAQLDDEWSKAAQAKDADKVASYYADDAMVYPPNEPYAIGPEAAHKIWAAYFSDTSFSISWKTLHASVANSGDFGFTAGTYENSFRGPDGKQVNEKGKYLCVWRKQKDGTWKAVQDMWNTDAR